MSTNRYILLLGEGNFSFATSLSKELQETYQTTSKFDPFLSPPSNTKASLIATDFKPPNWIPQETDAITVENIATLKSSGHLVFTDVNATDLGVHETLPKYAPSVVKVIWNFPHVQRKKMHIGLNRDLLRGFFTSVSKFIQDAEVEVVVTLCSGQSGLNAVEGKRRKWSDSWQIMEQAASGDFVLIHVEKFNRGGYYENSGYRERSFKGFNSLGANTFVFQKRVKLIPPPLEIRNSKILEDQIHQILSQASQSHPFHKILKKLNPTGSSEIKIIPDLEATSHPFFHLWILNIPAESIANLQTLFNISVDIFQDDSDLSYPEEHEGDVKSVVKLKDRIVGIMSDFTMSLNISNLIPDLKDSRVIYSKYFNVEDDLNNLENLDHDNNFSHTGNLFPLEHSADVSFWLGDDKDPKEVVKIAIISYGLLLKSFKLLEIYKKDQDISCDLLRVQGESEDAGEGFVRLKDVSVDSYCSYCYRIVIGSVDCALSKSAANEFHMHFREMLRNHLQVILR